MAQSVPGRWLFFLGILALWTPALFSQQVHENEVSPEASSSQVDQQVEKNEAHESADEAEQRSRLFWGTRGVVPGQNPSWLRLKALAQRNKMAKASARRMQQGHLDFNAHAWQSIGPSPLTVSLGGNLSGRVPAIAVDPTNPNTVFIGAADGGVWKTTDAGATWTPLTDSQPSLAIGALAIDPLNPNIIFAGTGEPFPANQFTYSAGLLKSTDGGATWTNIQQPFLQDGVVSYDLSQIAVDPQNDQIVLAASPSGALLRSTDGGTSWTIAVQGGFDAVVFDPNQQGLVYAGSTGDGAGYPTVWRSTDAGATWTSVTLNNFVGARVVMAVGTDSALYVGTGQTQVNVYKSTDEGQTFTELNNKNSSENLCTGQCNYNLAIAVSPKNPKELWFGGLYLNRSLDGGQTWEDLYGNYHSDQHAIVFSASGDRVYIGNDGGVYEANNPEAPANTSLLDLNNGLATLQFYQGISMVPGNLSTGVGGMQDNGTAVYSGSPGWSFVLGGDSFNTAMDPTNPNTVYTTSNAGKIYRSTSGGGVSTYSPFMNGLPAGTGFQTALTLDNTDPSRLYTFTAGQFYRTVDSSGVWQQASSLASGSPWGLAISISPIDHNVIWAAASASLGTAGYVSQNAAGSAMPTWNPVPLNLQRNVTRIAPDPLDTSVGYASVSGYAGFSGDNAGHVIRFAQYGSTWTSIGTGLPDVPANDLVADPGLPNTLYLATDVGVFVTSDGGASWAPMNNGLPNVIVTGLLLDNQTRTLRAGTHGRSVWQTTLPAALVFRTSVSSLSFASPGPGTASSPQTFLVLNSSPGPISLAATVSGPFSASNSCGAQLSTGQYCTYSVVFTPTAEGATTGSLQLTEPKSGSSAAIVLSGVAAALLAPASVDFGSVDLGSVAHQAVTFTNSKSSPLTINSLTPSGDFKLGTPSCVGVTLQASKPCTQDVVFSPTAAGARTGSLAVSDSLDTTSQTVALTGVGSDFSLALASSQLSVQPGSTGSVVVNLASSTNFTGSIVFSCSGLTSGITCSFQPSSVTLVSGAASSTLQIAVSKTSAHLWPGAGVDRRLAFFLILALSIPAVVLVGNKRTRRYSYSVLPVCMMLAVMFACGGVSGTKSPGGPSGPTNPPGPPGSNPSVVSVIVTAQAGTLQHSATLSVTVQ